MKKKNRQPAGQSNVSGAGTSGRAAARGGKTKRPRSTQKKGKDLFNQVCRLTGIPAKNIREELKLILDRKNIEVKNLTLDQLRMVVASYLREIMGSLLDRSHAKRPETNH